MDSVNVIHSNSVTLPSRAEGLIEYYIRGRGCASRVCTHMVWNPLKKPSQNIKSQTSPKYSKCIKLPVGGFRKNAESLQLRSPIFFHRVSAISTKPPSLEICSACKFLYCERDIVSPDGRQSFAKYQCTCALHSNPSLLCNFSHPLEMQTDHLLFRKSVVPSIKVLLLLPRAISKF